MGDQNPSSPLLHSDQAFQLYLTALVQSDLSSSIHHAAQRREALLRANPLPSSAESVSADVSQSQLGSYTDASQPTAGSSASVAPAAPVSRSQEIAQQVLVTASMPQTSQAHSIPIASSLSPNQQLAALVGAGGGGVNTPVHVVLSERESVFHHVASKMAVFSAYRTTLEAR